MSHFASQSITIVLAGGMGSRLHPLTSERAKPAVPFGGQYRIIDFTLSNCLHSGLRRVLVLTQYKSHSLQKHLRDGWSIFNPSVGEYITPIPPQMRRGESWYEGTANAVYQNDYLLGRSGARFVVILSGDHIYRMDYEAMLQAHVDSGADATIACMRVPRADATGFGVMNVDASSRITAFVEKPSDPPTIPGDESHSLASMGVYVFDIDVLREELRRDFEEPGSSHDFGKNLLPRIIRTSRVFAYEFGGERGRVQVDRYWRDVGTIDSYYEANMDLLDPVPAINLYQHDWPIRTYQRLSPPARTVPGAGGRSSKIVNCILCNGTIISGGRVLHSILGTDAIVEDGAVVERSLLFNHVRVRSGAILRNTIVDKWTDIPAGEVIGVDHDRDRERFTVSEGGVVVLPRAYSFD